jgi:redox-sensitive bicupin YhaK (pirin superfamily)
MIELVIPARPRDIDGFTVRRVLPSPRRRMIGPFVFFDHLGPSTVPPGQGLAVRPHPHIALATVTYLFAGEIVHRDSLGSLQTIRPGEVNWMTAGRGIVHSERSSDEVKKASQFMHGIQLWVALPTALEETDPAFDHYPADSIPAITRDDGVKIHVVAGDAYGQRSPVKTLSPLFYVVAEMPGGAWLEATDHEERAIYVAEGSIGIDGTVYEEGTMIVLSRGAAVRAQALAPARIAMVGGEPLDGERHIWWNFVSSSEERIERAKRDWKEGRFPKVPGDDVEFIPLPE